MKALLYLAPLLAVACLALLFPGCAADSKSAHEKPEKDTYTDPASGVVLPKHVEALDRVSIDDDDPDKNPVTAHYSPAGPAYYLDATVRIIPVDDASPDQLLSESIRSDENRPNFAQYDYRGSRNFGTPSAFCAECGFDRPESNDRVIVKIVIIPRGNFLLSFTFLTHPAQEQETGPVMDAFIQGVLASSAKKPVLMIPINTPAPDDAD